MTTGAQEMRRHRYSDQLKQLLRECELGKFNAGDVPSGQSDIVSRQRNWLVFPRRLGNTAALPQMTPM